MYLVAILCADVRLLLVMRRVLIVRLPALHIPRETLNVDATTAARLVDVRMLLRCKRRIESSRTDTSKGSMISLSRNTRFANCYLS